jgi:cytochrome c biogenesis protein CcdA
MEFLQNLVDSSNIPLFTAFILGIMTAISPCPLAMNITATAYLSKDITNKRKVLFNGIFYTLGRMFSYTALASLIFFWCEQIPHSKVVSANRRHLDRHCLYRYRHSHA